MAFSADVTTDVGKVRLLITDLDVTRPIFPDDSQIQTFLDLEGGEVKLAAAMALEVIAGNRALTMQVIKLLDLSMDGRATSDSLLKVAQRHRESVADDWSGFDIAQQIDNSDFTMREYFLKQAIAGTF